MSGWLADKKVVETWNAVVQKSEESGGEVPAKAFGEAATVLISVFDLITGMGMAKSDMQGNATTVTNSATDEAVTLQKLVMDEISNSGKTPKALSTDGKTTSCALLWLLRALQFILVMLENLKQDPSLELNKAVSNGYEASLKPHHGYAIKLIFNTALKAAPYRKDFMQKLGPSDEAVMEALGPVIAEVKPMVSALQAFLESKGGSDYFKP